MQNLLVKQKHALFVQSESNTLIENIKFDFRYKKLNNQVFIRM